MVASVKVYYLRQEQIRTPPGKLAELAPDIGATHHSVVDIRGKELKSNDADAAKPYSLWARITQRPLIEVQLPCDLSGFMLAPTFNYQEMPWRFDLFGGSRLIRGGRKSAAKILCGEIAPTALLPAIPYADTAPHCDTMELIAALAPQREDWSRI